jgi:hypothetical protein
MRIETLRAIETAKRHNPHVRIGRYGCKSEACQLIPGERDRRDGIERGWEGAGLCMRIRVGTSIPPTGQGFSPEERLPLAYPYS